MKSDLVLFQSNKFSLKLNHLIIIGVLILAFSTSMLIRSQPIEYGFELNEFDPFFNYRATEYIVENGLSEYYEWHDDKSWYPAGRDVSRTSQFMLHATTAISYQIFGGNSSLYDYTILFPAVIGSLTVVVIFGLVRLFAGTTAGLIASLLFAVSLPIILRGSIGWFKSEPLGIFYGLLALYLLLSALNSRNKKISLLKIIFGGVTLAFGFSSWGGIQFLILVIGLFIVTLPFFRKDHKFLLWSIPLFVGLFILVSSSFERPGIHFIHQFGGLTIILPTIFLVISIFIQKISKNKSKIRNNLFLLVSFILIGSLFVVLHDESSFSMNPSFRYLNAINPFLTTTDPLVDSVAEHSGKSINVSFLFHSVLMIFGGLGVWLILSQKISNNEIFINNETRIFVLLFSIVGLYVSSVFMRLEIFTSLSLIILSSIGLSILTKAIFNIEFSKTKLRIIKTSYIILIIFLFTLPLVIPESVNWVNGIDEAPTIFTGATNFPPSNDWIEVLEWIKLNTPEDAKIASWWDYGYWITVLGERTTYVDNATLDTKAIQNMATVLMSPPTESWKMLQEMESDYVVVFVAVQDIGNNPNDEPLYILGNGGDESKIIWFSRIAELPVQNYLNSDGKTPKLDFYDQTLLGKLIPFTPVVYYNPQTQENSPIFQDGFVEISQKKIKYDSINDPLKLVYHTSSFMNENDGKKFFVLVYEVNKNYSLS